MTEITILNEQPTSDVKDFIHLNYNSIYNGMDIMPKSKPTYISNGKDFLQFLENAVFDVNIYQSYKDYLRERTDIKAKSKQAKLTAAKVLLSALFYKYRLIPFDVTQGVKGFKIAGGHQKDGVNSDEIIQVKECISKIEDENKRVRFNAMFYLLVNQGLRQFEMCNLQYEDINFTDATALVQGKGSDDKTLIDLHPSTVKALIEYTDVFLIRSGYLFTSLRGTTKGKRLNERGFRKVFDNLFDTIGANRSAHGLRHYFVTQMLEVTNGDMGIVRKFSRHKTIAAVQMYDDRKRKKELLPTFYKAFD